MMYDSMPMNEGRILPTFSLREIDFPDVVNSDVGDQYYVVMKVEMVDKHAAKAMGLTQGNDANKTEGVFQMMSIKKLGVEPVDAKSLESKEFQNVVNKVMSGEL